MSTLQIATIIVSLGILVVSGVNYYMSHIREGRADIKIQPSQMEDPNIREKNGDLEGNLPMLVENRGTRGGYLRFVGKTVYGIKDGEKEELKEDGLDQKYLWIAFSPEKLGDGAKVGPEETYLLNFDLDFEDRSIITEYDELEFELEFQIEDNKGVSKQTANTSLTTAVV